MRSDLNEDGLTPSQVEYFRILEQMGMDDFMEKTIHNAKIDLAAYNRREDFYTELARTKPQRRRSRRIRAWLDKFFRRG